MRKALSLLLALLCLGGILSAQGRSALWESDSEDTQVPSPLDSISKIWFIPAEASCDFSDDAPENTGQTGHFDSDVPDEEFIRRLNNIHSAIPLDFNDIVRNFCILYSTGMKSSMGRIIGMGESYYWPVFDEILSSYGLPLELKALVIVESKMKPTATSRVGAKGLWQFMYTTAKGYGLTMDSWTDERMDPFKSTVAAARYLKNAYRIYGDWLLAIASYNCGPGNISKAIARSGGKRNFWDIYYFLPRETRGYVPAFIGALYACTYYREHGIVPEVSGMSVQVDTVIVRKDVHFGQIADVIGVDSTLVASLNPQYFNGVVPGGKYPCSIRLPYQYIVPFIESADSVHSFRKDHYLNPVEMKKIDEGRDARGKYVRYKVRSGDSLGAIARRYGVSVDSIRRWNSLKGTTIRIGQILVIYPRR